jgi:hypothetical protein
MLHEHPTRCMLEQAAGSLNELRAEARSPGLCSSCCRLAPLRPLSLPNAPSRPLTSQQNQSQPLSTNSSQYSWPLRWCTVRGTGRPGRVLPEQVCVPPGSLSLVCVFQWPHSRLAAATSPPCLPFDPWLAPPHVVAASQPTCAQPTPQQVHTSSVRSQNSLDQSSSPQCLHLWLRSNHRAPGARGRSRDERAMLPSERSQRLPCIFTGHLVQLHAYGISLAAVGLWTL